MKTSKSVSSKIETAVAGLALVMMTTVFFSSCKKEEVAQPYSAQTESDNAKQIGKLDIAPLRTVFASIKIQHIEFGLNLPNYSVTIYANGTVHYEGKSNVLVQGSRRFIASRKVLNEINELSKTFTAVSAGQMANDAEKCMSLVQTTYTPAGDLPILVFNEYNNPLPSKVTWFRNQVEKALNIAAYTTGNNHYLEEVK